MDTVTKNISRYVKDRGINVSKMARDTGISYMALYDSLLNDDRDREIRGRELLQVCNFLRVDPRNFADEPKEKE